MRIAAIAIALAFALPAMGQQVTDGLVFWWNAEDNPSTTNAVNRIDGLVGQNIAGGLAISQSNGVIGRAQGFNVLPPGNNNGYGRFEWTGQRYGLFPTSPCTFSAWVWSTGVQATTYGIAGNYSETLGGGVYFSVYRGCAVLSVNHAADARYVSRVSSITTSVARWQHVAGTYDGSGTTNGLRIYVNGQFDGASHETYIAGGVPTTCQTSQPFCVGTRGAFGAGSTDRYRFLGDLDDVRLYNSVLSDGEIALIYQDRKRGRSR